jgi:hypothetical protein
MSVAFTLGSLNVCLSNQQWRGLQRWAHQWIQASLCNWCYNTLKHVPCIIIDNNRGAEQPTRQRHSHWRPVHMFTAAIHGHQQSMHM